MCYWGLYQAESFSHSETKSYAQASLDKAVALAAHATAREKLYIRPPRLMRQPFARPAPRTTQNLITKSRFSAPWCERMPMTQMPASPSLRLVVDGYDDSGEPRKGKKEALALLQGVLKDEPENSAANHFGSTPWKPVRTRNRLCIARRYWARLRPRQDIWSTCRATSFTVPVITRGPRLHSMLPRWPTKATCASSTSRSIMTGTMSTT